MKFVAFFVRLLNTARLTFTTTLPTFSKPNANVSKAAYEAATPAPLEYASGTPPLSEDVKKNDIPVNPETISTPGVPSQPKTPEDFVQAVLAVAETVRESHGVQPLILITQAAHESNWGRSDLATNACNLFGMTAGTWYSQKRPIIWMPTHEQSRLPPEKIRYWEFPDDILWKKPRPGGGALLFVRRPFRKYGSWLFSMQDWATRLSTYTPYRTAYEYARKGDLANFALAIGKAGYATDAQYDEEIAGVGKVVTDILEKYRNA